MHLKNRYSISYPGLLILLIVGPFGISSCDDIVVYSPVPQITFISYDLKDSTDVLGNDKLYITLKFSAVDGDGNVGLNEFDTLSPFTGMYQYNFFSNLFYVKSGQYDSSGLGPYNYRIPYVEVDENKAYKAEISVEFEYFRQFLEYDTLGIDFFIVDRDLNHSDTIRTSPIPINLTGSEL